MQSILVVDDEPVVLNSVAGALQYFGFEVLRAASPEEAMRVGASRAHPIHLMICDVLMPGLGGAGLAEKFRDFHPETQCLFVAGLPDHPEVLERVLRRGYAFLAKPFLPRQLVAKVREMLDGPAARTVGAEA